MSQTRHLDPTQRRVSIFNHFSILNTLTSSHCSPRSLENITLQLCTENTSIREIKVFRLDSCRLPVAKTERAEGRRPFLLSVVYIQDVPVSYHRGAAEATCSTVPVTNPPGVPTILSTCSTLSLFVQEANVL